MRMRLKYRLTYRVRAHVHQGIAVFEPERRAPGRRVEILALSIGPDLDEGLGVIV